MKSIITAGTLAAIASFAIVGQDARACTRVVYTGDSSLYVVGRSLDWKTPIPTNVYVYPSGMAKIGSDRPGAIEWVSKYGAVMRWAMMPVSPRG